MPIVKDDLRQLVSRYKSDPESVYNTWFIESQARLKAFRSIRRGVIEVVKAVREGTFGNDFKGSPLETVLDGITEQKQVFEGAAHPFYWKPKLRIPDIYENEENKRAFGQFLDRCLGNLSADRMIREILWLDGLHVKGLGPAVANILYFLCPTVFPPFSTAMVRGFNALFEDSKKLGSWTEYLSMRDVIIKANSELQPALSTDLGAFSGPSFRHWCRQVNNRSNQYCSTGTRARKARESSEETHRGDTARPAGRERAPQDTVSSDDDREIFGLQSSRGF